MIFDICGWIGTVLVLIAYALLSTKKIENGNFPKNAWFSFALQVVWGLIAIFAIVKNIKIEKNK